MRDGVVDLPVSPAYAAPLALKAGESYKVPPSAIHDARTDDKGATVIVTYVVEKEKPLASPASHFLNQQLDVVWLAE